MGQAVRPVAVPARDPGRADGRARSCGGTRRRRDLDLDLVFGARRTSRFGTPVRGGAARAYRQGSGRPGRAGRGRGVPADAATWPPSARRTARARRPARWRGRSRAWDDDSMPAAAERALDAAAPPRRDARPRPIVPGERQFRDGDRVRHAPLGRRHRRDLQADPQRRGGHGRVPGPGGRPQDDAGEPREPRDHRLTSAEAPWTEHGPTRGGQRVLAPTATERRPRRIPRP